MFVCDAVEYSAAFQKLFRNCGQFQHFQNHLTGLIALDNKTMVNMTRCIIRNPDKTNSSRFLSTADGGPDEVNKERLACPLAHKLVTNGAGQFPVNRQRRFYWLAIQLSPSYYRFRGCVKGFWEFDHRKPAMTAPCPTFLAKIRNLY